jgi:hypothetical protein
MNSTIGIHMDEKCACIGLLHLRMRKNSYAVFFLFYVSFMPYVLFNFGHMTVTKSN